MIRIEFDPRSLTHSGSKLNLPVLPNVSTSGSWQINLVTMSVFLISEMWYQVNLPLSSLTSALLPWTQTTLKSTLYFGMKHLLVWSLTNTRSPTSIFGFFTGCWPSITLSRAILRLWICVWKILDINSRSNIRSSVPMYLSFGLVSCERFVTASLPNIMKNGDSFECWFGNQLYEAVARGTTLSHSRCLEMCFARQLLRNLWKPSILPLDWGLYGGE